MTDLRSLRATTPEDLLALVPGLLGFHPHDSVVLLTGGGAGTPFHARVDIPCDPSDVDPLVDYLTQVAIRSGMARGAIVVYTEDRARGEAAGAALADGLLLVGVDVACALRVDGRRWWVLGEGGPGTPYDVTTHPFTVQAVVDGAVVLGSRQDLVESLVCSDPEELERVSALAGAELDLLRATPRPRRRVLGDWARWLSARVRRFVEDGERLDLTDVARLVTAVTVHVDVRDVAWAEMSRADARRHVDLWRDVVRRTPPELSATPAALLGLASWLAGDGALAWCAVDRALEADPDHSLARLLGDLLTDAVPPSVWQPLPREALTVLTE